MTPTEGKRQKMGKMQVIPEAPLHPTSILVVTQVLPKLAAWVSVPPGVLTDTLFSVLSSES